MIISHEGRFVFFASTKAASTAIEAVLLPYASVAITRPPEAKHISVRYYEKMLEPFIIKQNFGKLDRIAVMRDPVEWVFSWYRYRTRDEIIGMPNSTAKLSFDEFVDGYLADEKPNFAKIGRPSKIFMASGKNTETALDFIYDYHALNLLEADLSDRLERDIRFEKRLNVSPLRTIDLSPDREARLVDYLADDYRIFENAIR